MNSDLPQAAETVDRGRYPQAVTPWEDEAWRAAALEWVDEVLAAHGLRAVGRPRVRLRPWSVLVRLDVGTASGRGGDRVWFKANPPASAFEAGLGAALAGWVPEHVLRPLAVDAGRGWSLLPDGGRRFADVLDAGEAGPEAWEEMLGRYAKMQRALLPYTGKIESLGVPGARTAALPEVFDRLVAENGALTDAERTALDGLRPRVAEWSAELAQTGIGDCVDHADLHEGQVFHAPSTGRFTFFDWGDAAVTHPFCSFLVPARRAVERYGPDLLPRLRDAYLAPWTDAGRTLPDLRRTLSLAWRLGALGRAWAWGRLFPGAVNGTEPVGGAEGARSLLQLADAPPRFIAPGTE